ncbi:MAG: flagellar protein FlgN [Porticoccus sp.]
MTVGQQLASLLNHEIACLEQLLAILDREFESLTSSDISAIEAATNDKNLALARQGKSTLTRQQFVTSSSYEDSDKGLQQLITTCDNHTELATIYAQLTSLARQCHSTNRTNGRLILQKQEQTRSALNIIRQADNNPSTYSDQGGSITNPSTRSLGKA